MSTNYYARTPDTAANDKGLHIGKRVAGWEFMFRAHPELGLNDCDAWHALLERADVEIVSDYWVVEPLAEFWAMATRRPADEVVPWMMRSQEDEWGRNDDRLWTDAHGHPFSDREFC